MTEFDIKGSLVTESASIQDAAGAIQDGGKQICLVIDKGNRLVGSVTDGDLRRGLLQGIPVHAAVTEIMNKSPIFVLGNTTSEKLLETIERNGVQQIPLVDIHGRIESIVHLHDLSAPALFQENVVVLMAGGLGSRLMPLTDETPKPLLPVGNKPVLEIILESFANQQFHNFYISVNYKSEAIKEYFGNGEKWGVNIQYLEENQRLGTAGALKLIPVKMSDPIIVMNADVLTRINFLDLLDYHATQNSKATMCVREHDYQVPYGVVGIVQDQIIGIEEKPTQRFFVNAGIYVLDGEVIDLVPNDEYFDMTSLFDLVIRDKIKTVAYPIHEYWADIGRIEDLNRANQDYAENFDI
jgi:dTDP-glucose pyrophosphorylase